MAMEKLETYNKQLAQIEGQGREIIQKAKAKADTHALDILNEANVKANGIIMQAEKEIERQQTKAISEMKKEVGTLALMAAEKIMEKNLEDSGDQDEIIDKILKEAGTSGWQN
jgi:F-type H+-transporting ATPase subunit b